MVQGARFISAKLKGFMYQLSKKAWTTHVMASEVLFPVLAERTLTYAVYKHVIKTVAIP